jgi:hypothetical protein
MTSTTFQELVDGVVCGLRDLSPRSTVELGIIHGFCVDAAKDNAPTLVSFLSSVDGLQALSAALARMPETVTAVGVDGATWRFVDKN